MPCDCEKAHTTEQEDPNGGNDKPKSCPDGQKFDATAGKCVPEGGEKGRKEQIGDPKAVSTQAELPAANPSSPSVIFAPLETAVTMKMTTNV